LAGHVVDQGPVLSQPGLPGVLKRGLAIERVWGVVTGFGDFHAKLGEVELLVVSGGDEGSHAFEIGRSDDLARGEVRSRLATRLEPHVELCSGDVLAGDRGVRSERDDETGQDGALRNGLEASLA
jgi:hypothetical protein